MGVYCKETWVGHARWEGMGQQFKLGRLNHRWIVQQLQTKDMECKQFSWEPGRMAHRGKKESFAFRVPVPARLLAKCLESPSLESYFQWELAQRKDYSLHLPS